ncbi:pitrilysin family protein [Nakamurella sp. A5-74]|uniref:Pitrilysin family protein n=1 Tax=Nakamurella sp. A5-74 TaxID=3158264 RepID=A0AAU8DK86_9ACTN
MSVRTRSTRVLERAGLPARQGPGSSVDTVRMSVLSGGLRVVTEEVASSRSVSVGIWVGVGSIDEASTLAGSSHFLEHLLFKGTRHRTGREIAASMDAVGGEFNAFTAHEYTCYYTHVLAEQAEFAIDVVSDVVLDAVIAAADVEVERSVILEEIAMRDDDPEDTLADTFAEGIFAGHPVAGPVIGTPRSIEAMTRSQVAGYYRRRYTPDRMVVAVAGDVDHADVVRWVKRNFASRLSGDASPRPARVLRGAGRPDQQIRVATRDTEQAHLMVGSAGFRRDDPRRHAMAVLSTVLGGGMSSRLFRTIREENGLAYSCYATAQSFTDIGSFAVYAGCAPSNLETVATLIAREWRSAVQDGFTEEEVRRARGQLAGSMALSLEDTESRMSRIGRNVLVRTKFTTVDDELAALAAVTVDDVWDVARTVLDGPMSAAVVGPYAGVRDLPGSVGDLLTPLQARASMSA